MNGEPGGPFTYTMVGAGSGVTFWNGGLETTLGVVVAALTIAVLAVRLCVDVPRVIRKFRKWKER